MGLTKDADKMICCIYKSFLQRHKHGETKSAARRFEKDYLKENKHLSSIAEEDLKFTLLELGKKELVRITIGGAFELTDAGIIYMESRFKNDLIEVTDFISKFIP